MDTALGQARDYLSKVSTGYPLDNGVALVWSILMRFYNTLFWGDQEATDPNLHWFKQWFDQLEFPPDLEGKDEDIDKAA